VKLRLIFRVHQISIIIYYYQHTCIHCSI
jgi:hypothetical protein